jgi:hypothetical protein
LPDTLLDSHEPEEGDRRRALGTHEGGKS